MAAMTPEMQAGDDTRLTFQYGVERTDVEALYRDMIRIRHPRMRILASILLVLAAIDCIIAIVGHNIPAVVLSCIAAGAALLISLTPQRLARRYWRTHHERIYRVIFDSSGFTGATDDHTTSITWRKIQQLRSDSRYVYLHSQDMHAVIALRALPDGMTAERFMHMIRGWQAEES